MRTYIILYVYVLYVHIGKHGQTSCSRGPEHAHAAGTSPLESATPKTPREKSNWTNPDHGQNCCSTGPLLEHGAPELRPGDHVFRNPRPRKPIWEILSRPENASFLHKVY